MGRFLATLGIAAIGFAAGAAQAQDADGVCDIDEGVRDLVLAPALDGFWQVEMGPGSLTMQGRTIALPPGQPSVASITVEDGEMTIGDGFLGGSFPLRWVDGRGWDMTPGEDVPVDPDDFVDDEELGVLVGCTPEELPRLHAEGDYTDPESGLPVHFDLRLFVAGPGILHGMTEGQTPRGVARRVVTMMK